MFGKKCTKCSILNSAKTNRGGKLILPSWVQTAGDKLPIIYTSSLPSLYAVSFSSFNSSIGGWLPLVRVAPQRVTKERDVVYLGWPIAPSYMAQNTGGGGGSCGVSANEYSWHRVQLNFGDLTPYLTYDALSQSHTLAVTSGQSYLFSIWTLGALSKISACPHTAKTLYRLYCYRK